jgi:hypothetical protein
VLLTQETTSPSTRAVPAPPRIVRRKPGTLGIYVIGRILSAPLMAVAIALAALVVLEPVVAFLFPPEAAHIVAQWRQFEARHGLVCYVKYQLDLSRFVGRDEVLFSEFSDYRVGTAVKAHVFHFGPTGYSILDRSIRNYARNRAILWFCASFLTAIAWVLFHALWFIPWRNRELVRFGRATYGAVVEKHLHHGSRRLISCALIYQFKVKGVLRMQRLRVAPQRFDDARLGELVIICFDPFRPSRSIVYDYCDFIAV